MLLDLEELLIERNEFRALQFSLCGELLLGVGEDFFAMSENIGSHGGCAAL